MKKHLNKIFSLMLLATVLLPMTLIGFGIEDAYPHSINSVKIVFAFGVLIVSPICAFRLFRSKQS